MQLRTPYDGSSRLFQIGLKPLAAGAWFDPDADLPAFLAEKARLNATLPDAVFAAEPGSEAAGAEVLARLAAHLPERYPELYRRAGAAIDILPAGRRVELDAARPALLSAASLVQEDLVLMEKRAAGWCLAAASLCFPSAWRLADKIGRPMAEIHAPVPGFGGATRNAGLIERMFDHLRPDTPVLRWNWSLYGDAELFHPADSPPRRFGPGERADPVFLRVERQTLTRLPATGAILFTIRIYVDPLAALERHPDAAPLARAISEQLAALDEAQLAYKGLREERPRLLARLGEIAAP